MNLPNARDRIMKAALKIFAEKSFEGSRIDEIAKEAKVPKSLIYYHFKSKEDILQEMVNQFIKEYCELIFNTVEESNEEKSEKLPGRLKNVYYEFGLRNEDLIRVILIDSLKKSTEKPVLFQIMDAMIAKEAEYKKHLGYDIQERRVAEFFTSFIPLNAYLCFADGWTRYFNLERSQFDQIFMKVYQETHGAYHISHDKKDEK